MTPSLVRGPGTDSDSRVRDWAEIQERMLVPLYEAVYDRLEVGPATRLLALGCGSGLALLMAARRGCAVVTGCDPDARRLALARQRLLPEPRWGAPPPVRTRTALVCGPPPSAADGKDGTNGTDEPDGTGRMRGTNSYTIVTALDPTIPADLLLPALTAAGPLAGRGSPVVLAGWGPSERCATSRVLRIAARLAEPRRDSAGPRARWSGRDDLEELARAAGLRPDGSGRVACPFGYPDMNSAVRGLMSTRLFDTAVDATDRQQVEKEITEALHAYRRPDGGVRMENVFRYVIACVV